MKNLLEKILYRERLEPLEVKDIVLIENITGSKFSEVPKVFRASENKIKEILKEKYLDTDYCVYLATKNEIYISENLRNQYELELGKIHELGHALFSQNSLAKKEMEKEGKEPINRIKKIEKKKEKTEKEARILEIINPKKSKIYEYFYGKNSGTEYLEKEVQGVLDLFTLVAISEGFANLLTHSFLQRKYDFTGSFVYLNNILYLSKLVIKLPPSYMKLQLLMCVEGTFWAQNKKSTKSLKEIFRELLEVRKADLPQVRKEMINLFHSRIVKNNF